MVRDLMQATMALSNSGYDETIESTTSASSAGTYIDYEEFGGI